MSGLRTYSSRMRARAVSRDVLPPWPDATLADLAALVYRQRWRTPDGRTRVVHLLAFDDAHAVTVARLAGLVECFAALEENTPIDAEAAVRAEILRHESESVWQARQDDYARRERRQ